MLRVLTFAACAAYPQAYFVTPTRHAQPRDAQKPRAASVLRRSSNCNDDEQPRRRSVVVPSAAAVGETETQMITSNVQGNVSVPEVFVGNDGLGRQLFDNGVVLPVGWTGASTRRRTGSRFAGGAMAQTSWPVGEASANPGSIAPFSRRTWLRGLREDAKRRLPMYATDWADGFRSPGKTLGASAFLYFAVLAPAIAFGGAMTAATSGVLGPRDVILSCGLSGMAYATLAGQPMTFVAPTGLTLAFIGALSSWTVKAGVPFLPMYAWCGVWTSCYLAVLASFNASGLIKYCTRFTEDVFNALLAFNFLSEGASPIVRLLRSVGVGAARPGDALLAMNSALATSVACTSLAGAPRTRFFTAKFRTLIADFGPAFVIVAMSALLRTDAMTGLGSLARLELGAPRAKMFSLVDLGSLAVRYRLLAAIPALFLATLFFLDQNITVRTVNSPQNKLAKDSAYHLDLLALATITLGSSLLGLPWMCSATVQSLNHVRAMSNIAAAEETVAEAPAKPAPRPDEAKRTVAVSQSPLDRKQPPLPSPDEIIRAAQLKRNATAPSAAARPPPKTPKPAPPPLPTPEKACPETVAAAAKRDFAAAEVGEAVATPAQNATAGAANATRAPPVAAPVAAGGGGAAVASMRQKANATAAAAAAPAAPQKPEGDVASVVETRLSGFLVHGLVLASLNVAPLLSQVPLAVVWGVFLFLGQKVMSGNQFLGRSKALLLDTKRLDPTDTVERAIVELGRGKVLKFTAVQAGCLATLWLLKLNKATAMVFPSVIGVLLALRAIFIPRFFAARELLQMDTEMDI